MRPLARLPTNRDPVAVLKERRASFDDAEEPGAHTFHLRSRGTVAMLAAVDGDFNGTRRSRAR